MKFRIAILAGLVALSGEASGTVTLSFNNEASGISSNFANAGGAVSNNMFYGVIVDGNGDGFLSAYGGPAITLALSGTYVLTTSGGLADDVLYLAEFQTGDTSVYDGSQTGGNGGMFTLSDLAFQGLVGTGDAFRIVWFGGGDGIGFTPNAGVLADTSFTLPSDGSSTDYTNPFAGGDPIRSSGLAYSGTSGTPLGLGLSIPIVVPEPSSAVLAVVGALGCLRRRR